MININEVSAGFMYNGSSVKKCLIDNSIVTLGEDAKYQLQLDFSTSICELKDGEDLHRGRVILSIQCDVSIDDNKDIATGIEFVIEGEFCVKRDMPDDKFSQMLAVNGVSSLYGIARSKLEVITAMVYHDGKISLPMINVLALVNQKSEQERKESEQI